MRSPLLVAAFSFILFLLGVPPSSADTYTPLDEGGGLCYTGTATTYTPCQGNCEYDQIPNFGNGFDITYVIPSCSLTPL